MKRNTKLSIGDEFIRMVAASSLSRMRIADLIESLDINRNTFYYYFSNKYEVAMWVFRKDLAAELHASFSEYELISSQLGGKDGDKTLYPYYVHIEIGARTLDFSGFLKALVRCTAKREEFYRKLFAPDELELASCMTRLFQPAIEDDIDFILGGRYMPPETRTMLGTLCTRHIIALVGYCLESGARNELLDDRVNPFWNLIQESLQQAIQAHPINRYTRRPSERHSVCRGVDVEKGDPGYPENPTLPR